MCNISKALIVLWLFFLPMTLFAETYALVIGINKYEKSRSFSDLKGAVNDADLLYETFIRTGIPKSNIVKLVNQKATKHRIEQVWDKMIARSKPRDTLIFTFAGHGNQEPDENHDEMLIDPNDKWDETLLLSGYADLPHEANKERLVDDELYTLWKRAKGRRIIYVADSCHSGGTTRSIDGRAKKHAWTARVAPPSTVKLSNQTIVDTKVRLKEIDLEDFYLFAATESRKQSLEGIIEGKHHGAMSWAFAKALEYSISNRRASISYSDLRSYVEQEVKNQTYNRQFTDIRPRGSGNDVLFRLNTKNPVKRKKESNNQIIKFSILGQKPSWINNLENIKIVSRNPDFIWDNTNGDIINKQGDITAFNIKNRDQLSQIINRNRLLSVVDQLTKGHFIQSQLSPPDSKDKNSSAKLHRFCSNSCISFSISDLDADKTNLYQFNIAGNGETQCFELESVRGSKTYEFNATPPAGNDTLVTLVLNKKSKKLSKLITKYNCANSLNIAKHLPLILKNHSYQLGRVDTFTGR